MSEPKFSIDIQEKIVAYLEASGEIKDACILAGISYATYKRWKQWGDPENPEFNTIKRYDKYRAFRAACEHARAISKTTLVGIIRQAAITDWKAAYTILQHSHQGIWLPLRQRVESKSLDTPTPKDALQDAEDRNDSYIPPTIPTPDQDGE